MSKTSTDYDFKNFNSNALAQEMSRIHTPSDTNSVVL